VRARATGLGPALGPAARAPATAFKALLVRTAAGSATRAMGVGPRAAPPRSEQGGPEQGGPERGAPEQRPEAERAAVQRPRARERPPYPCDPLDPAFRQSAQNAPFGGPATAPLLPLTGPEVRPRASLEDLLPQIVKRIAWGGDARKGSVRMELGGGVLAGGTVLVHADEGRVRVELATPPGCDPAEWRRRIEARLVARGIAVDAIEVT